MATGKYIYRCSLRGCGEEARVNVAPTYFPTCNGNNGSHSKLMDFIEEESVAVPSHILDAGIKKSVLGDKNSGYRARDGGNWV